MRLEQQIIVRLGPGDVTQLKSRHTLTVACACGQHINLAWDGQASAVEQKALLRRQRQSAAALRNAAKRRARMARAKKEERKWKEKEVELKPVTCRICKRQFKSLLARQVHIQRAHKGIGPQKQKATAKLPLPEKPSAAILDKAAARYFCPADGCTHPPFTTVQGMVMHRRRVHEGFNPNRQAGAGAKAAHA